MDPIGQSPVFLEAIDTAKRVAPSNASILICGESGTGKEVFANFIHNNSRRNKQALIAINCSSIPEQLLESELFGHHKGSFTGASDTRIGLFEEATGGTLFLDEIGDLSLPLQAKLLRVLQERKIKRVGENIAREINCRIVSATHKNLSIEVDENRFREDLFFRLNVIPITIPPLRDRHGDIIPLAEAFLKKFSIENKASAKSFSQSALKYILENRWRGNVRELENAIERAVVLCQQSEISIEDFLPLQRAVGLKYEPKGATNFAGARQEAFCLTHQRPLPTLEEVMNKYICYAVSKNDGAKDRTAREIGIDRKTLYKKVHAERISNEGRFLIN